MPGLRCRWSCSASFGSTTDSLHNRQREISHRQRVEPRVTNNCNFHGSGGVHGGYSCGIGCLVGSGGCVSGDGVVDRVVPKAAITSDT
mmetsp:Transcript_85454/g.169548  ORF Transcript_85454/g.169548 Transcript_85454/m.169548 type:complete len:88 (+) Transcript_85454:877-1140(+)